MVANPSSNFLADTAGNSTVANNLRDLVDVGNWDSQTNTLSQLGNRLGSQARSQEWNQESVTGTDLRVACAISFAPLTGLMFKLKQTTRDIRLVQFRRRVSR